MKHTGGGRDSGGTPEAGTPEELRPLRLPLPGEPPSPAPLPRARPRWLRSGARVGGAAHVGVAARAAVS